MKIRANCIVAVAAVVALAGAVHADRPSETGANQYRIGAVGLTEVVITPGARSAAPPTQTIDHLRIQQAHAEIRRARDRGRIDLTRLLFDPALLGPGYEGGAFGDREASSHAGSGHRSDVNDGLKFSHFDGFQTYDLGMLSGQSSNAPAGAGIGLTRSHLLIVDAADETSQSPNDPGSLNLRGPRNPFAPDPYPEGTSAREQILHDSRTDVASLLSSPQTQWTLFTDALYVPRLDSNVVTGLDIYYNNHETLTSVDIFSSNFHCISTRVLDAGRFEDSYFTSETGGVLDRPLVLGLLPGSVGFGGFFGPPLQPRDSAGDPAFGLDRFRTQTGGWFTLAVVITTEGLTVWIRNDLTDGSGPQGVLIEDPDPADPIVASGWYRLYPGRPADHLGANVWTGYGVALNEFDQPAVQFPHIVAAKGVDGIRESWFTSGIPDDTSGWNPAGKYFDNWFITGEPFASPPIPKSRLPYKDDMELYFPGMPAAFTSSFNDIYGGQAVVAFGDFNGFTVNSSPSPGSHGGVSDQSIMQRNVSGSGVMRSEFYASGLSMGVQSAVAQQGDPLAVSAQLRLTSNATVRGMQIEDSLQENLSEFLMMGAIDPDTGSLIDRFFIRRVNPFFDAGAPSSAAARIYDTPDTAQNAPHINLPTVDAVSPLTDAGSPASPFFHAELTLSGDGTGFWSVNGQPLVFDLSGFSSAEESALVAEFEMAQATAGEPTGPPYSRFFTDLTKLDSIHFWSGNQPLGVDDRIFVDDICIDGVPLVRSPGPAYELPFCEDFAGYTDDLRIAGHGSTPVVFVNTSDAAGMSIRQLAILATEDDALADPGAEWCSYTVEELFDGDPGWGVSVGDVLYIRKPPIAGFECPERDDIAGLANLTLLDADPDGLDPCPLRVGAASGVVGDGAAADVRASFTRYAPNALYCRYEITELEAEIDHASGGVPFNVPDELVVGAVLAVSNPIDGDCVGVFNSSGDSLAFNATLLLFRDGACAFATGRVRLVKPEESMRSGGPPACPPVPAQDDDVRGYGVLATPLNLWGGFSSPFVGGVVRNAQNEIDEALSMSIDPSGDRGNVLAYFNSGAVAATEITGGIGAGLASQNTINVPTVVAGDATSEARVCWDIYIQDNNTRIITQVNGPRFNEKDAPVSSAPVARIRFGGPPADPPTTADPIGNDTEIAVQIIIPPMGFGAPITAWEGTGVHRPTGQWFTSCIEVDVDGDWTLEVDGSPIASGASLTQPNMGISAPMGIANLQLRSGFDEGGTGYVDPTPFVVRSLGKDAARPVGLGPDDFCFYQLLTIDSGATAEFHPVHGATGEALLDEQDELISRIVNSPDNVIVAVAFGAAGLNSFADCPQGEAFTMVDGADATIATGIWMLTGRPDVLTSFVLPPAGGVVNAGGPAGNGFAYNFESPTDGHNPYRNILLAESVTLPVHEPPGVPSRWWFDNIKVEAIGAPPPCPWDLTGDGNVGSGDLGILLGCWGGPATGACASADFSGSGAVGSADLAALLGAWGPCPQE